jgi:hypothetical protein
MLKREEIEVKRTVAKALRFYFGGERQTKEGCSPELATFLAEQFFLLIASSPPSLPSRLPDFSGEGFPELE